MGSPPPNKACASRARLDGMDFLPCCGKRAKDRDPLVPPPIPHGLHRTEILSGLANALSAEYDFGWEHSVEDWVEGQGAGWIYSKHVPTDSDSRSDRFWSWCVFTVQRAVRSKRVSVSSLCEHWAVPLPEQANSAVKAEKMQAKKARLHS